VEKFTSWRGSSLCDGEVQLRWGLGGFGRVGVVEL